MGGGGGGGGLALGGRGGADIADGRGVDAALPARCSSGSGGFGVGAGIGSGVLLAGGVAWLGGGAPSPAGDAAASPGSGICPASASVGACERWPAGRCCLLRDI
jgi:hypothetical protein